MNKVIKESGALIIEVLIAVVFLITATLSIYSVLRTTQNRTLKTQFSTEMTVLAQNAVEISYENLLSDWTGFTAGYYYPAFNSSQDKWVLMPTSSAGETNLETKFTRVIEIKKVCRSTINGEISNSSPCPYSIDPDSKIIAVKVGWVNPNFGKPLNTELLVTQKR